MKKFLVLGLLLAIVAVVVSRRNTLSDDRDRVVAATRDAASKVTDRAETVAGDVDLTETVEDTVEAAEAVADEAVESAEEVGSPA